MSNNSSSFSKIVLIGSAVIAVLSVYILLTNDLQTKPLAGQGQLHEDLADIGGDFTLIDQNNQTFTSDNLKNRLAIIYFGFTYCPDICPTSLQKLTHVIEVLDKYNIDVLPIFITIDPQRDTPKLLQEYLSHFHPKFLGLTGTQKQIEEVAKSYKVYYAKSVDASAAETGQYMLDHSSFVYIMKDGAYVKHFYLTSSPEEIINFIRINH